MAIRSQLARQIDRFIEVAGVLPDFIDGHEHVHVFPVVADVVRRLAEELNPQAPIPIRSVGDSFGPTDAPLKRAMIRGLAAMGKREAAGVRQISLNSGFAGDYSLSRSADFPDLLQTWLELAPDRALIMCHPREATDSDPGSTGARELRFLSSTAFSHLLRWHSIRFLNRDEIAAGVCAQQTSDREHTIGLNRAIEPTG